MTGTDVPVPIFRFEQLTPVYGVPQPQSFLRPSPPPHPLPRRSNPQPATSMEPVRSDPSQGIVKTCCAISTSPTSSSPVATKPRPQSRWSRGGCNADPIHLQYQRALFPPRHPDARIVKKDHWRLIYRSQPHGCWFAPLLVGVLPSAPADAGVARDAQAAGPCRLRPHRERQDARLPRPPPHPPQRPLPRRPPCPRPLPNQGVFLETLRHPSPFTRTHPPLSFQSHHGRGGSNQECLFHMSGFQKKNVVYLSPGAIDRICRLRWILVQS